MKKIIIIFLLLLVCCFPLSSYGQLISMDFPVSMNYLFYDRPSMDIVDDTLFVCSTDGIYARDMKSGSGWESYAFKGLRIFDFVKNGDLILGLGCKDSNETPTFIVLSVKGGNPEDVTPYEHQGQGHYKYYRANSLAKNPDATGTVLLGTDKGILISNDFGVSWEYTSCYPIFGDLLHFGIMFNPSDPSEVVCYGEQSDEMGAVFRLKNLELVSTYEVPEICQPILDFIFNTQDTRQRCYCGTETFGASEDGGETWKEIKQPRMSGTLVSKKSDEGTVYVIGCSPFNELVPTMLHIYQYKHQDGSWSHHYQCGLPSGMTFIYDALFWGDDLILLTDVGVYSISDFNRIESPTVQSSPKGLVYDISGRSLSSVNHHGVIIQNGRKFVVR